MIDHSREFNQNLSAQAAASLVENDSYWLAEFSRAARGDSAAGLVAFALFRSWHAGREAEFVQRTGRPAAEFAPEFLPLVRPEILDRIVADARAVMNGATPNRGPSYEPEHMTEATPEVKGSGVLTAFAACFLALFAFSAVQSIAGVPALAFEPWRGIDFSPGPLAVPGILLSGLAIGYAMRPRRRLRRRKIHYLAT